MPAAFVLPAVPLPPYLLALAACAAYAAVLWRMDLYTPADVRHWERLAALRGLQPKRDLGDRIASRLPLLARVREEVDIGLLLMIAGSLQSAESWLLGTAGYALGAAALLAATDAVGQSINGQLPLPLWAVLAVLVVVAALRYVALRAQAFNRQSTVNDQLSDALLGLAILVPGIPAEDALDLLARCQFNGRLAEVLDDVHLKQVLGTDAGLRSTRERYWMIGRALRIPLFQELSLIMRGIETEGLSPREEYPALSRISATARLSQNRLRAARAKTGAAAAIALLLVPLLMLVAGGIAFAFLGSVSG